MIKDADEQPDEQRHRVKSEGPECRSFYPMEVSCVTFPEDAIRKMGNSDLYVYSQLVRITSDAEQGLMGPTGTEAFLSPISCKQDPSFHNRL